MKKKKTVFKILMLMTTILLSVGLVACRKTNITENGDDKPNSKIETVKVKSGNIIPTLSTKTEIKKATDFVVLSEEKGVFKSNIANGEKVKKDQIIGYVNSKEVKSPVDATVHNICEDNEVPKNFPLVTLSYTGFSIDIEADTFLQLLSDSHNYSLKAKFQVQDGIGPEEVMAVVHSSENTTTLQCLIGQDSEVKMGQLVTVVVTSDLKKDVMILPLSVIAGRFKSGMVTKVIGNEKKNVKIELGSTDGSYIEVISGLNVGDEVLALPPNLDPRDN